MHDASDSPHCGSLILQLYSAVVQPGGAAASLLSSVSFGQEGDLDSSWKRRGFTSTRVRFGQAAKRPSDDLSGAEVETAVRLGEHLLHLQRTQRRSLAAAAAAHATLCRLASVTGSISASEPLPNQVRLPHTHTTHARTHNGYQRQTCCQPCNHYCTPDPGMILSSPLHASRWWKDSFATAGKLGPVGTGQMLTTRCNRPFHGSGERNSGGGWRVLVCWRQTCTCCSPLLAKQSVLPGRRCAEHSANISSDSGGCAIIADIAQ